MSGRRRSAKMAGPNSADKHSRFGFPQRSGISNLNEQPESMLVRSLKEIKANNGSIDVQKCPAPRRLTSHLRPTLSPYTFGKTNSDHKYNKHQGTRKPLFLSYKTNSGATVKSECNANSVIHSKYVLRSSCITEERKESPNRSVESKYKRSNIPVFSTNKTLNYGQTLPVTKTALTAVTATSCTRNETVAIANAKNLTTINTTSIQIPNDIQGSDLSKVTIREKKKSITYVHSDRTVAALCSGSSQVGPKLPLPTYKRTESDGKENKNPMINFQQSYLGSQPLILDSSAFPKSPKQCESNKRKYATNLHEQYFQSLNDGKPEKSNHRLEKNPLEFALQELGTIKAQIASLEDFLRQQTCANPGIVIPNEVVPSLSDINKQNSAAKTSLLSDKRQSAKKRKSTYLYNQMRSSHKFLETPDTASAYSKKPKTAVNAPMDTPARNRKISHNLQKQLDELYDS